jgi:hypothetical protein
VACDPCPVPGVLHALAPEANTTRPMCPASIEALTTSFGAHRGRRKLVRCRPDELARYRPKDGRGGVLLLRLLSIADSPSQLQGRTMRWTPAPATPSRCSSLAKFKSPSQRPRLVWRISKRAPNGEWVDPAKVEEDPSPTTPTTKELPEVSSGSWVTSSFDLLSGTDISEDNDTIPGELLDEMFPPPGTMPKAPKKG